MAISQASINNNLQALAPFLSGCLDLTVTYQNNTITIKSGSDAICTITRASSDNNHYYQFDIYYTPSTGSTLHEQFQYGSSNTAVNLVNAWRCSEGAMLDFRSQDNDGIPFYIVKTNNYTSKNKEAAFLYTKTINYSNAMYTQLSCITKKDTGSLLAYTFDPTETRQTIICPMPTNSTHGTLSYTSNAGFIPFNNEYNCAYGEMILNNKHYLTNSYFAIEDMNNQ